MTLEQHVRYTGRTGVVSYLMPAARRVIDWFLDFIDSDGLLSGIPGWTFIDWSMELERNGQVTTLNAIFAEALRSYSRAAELVGIDSSAADCDAIANSITRSINTLLYDPDRGLYADARINGARSTRCSQHANASVIAFGIAPPNRRDGILDAIMDPGSLMLARAWSHDDDRPFDPEVHVAMAQPFFSHYVHAALAREGRVQPLLESIREKWLPMARMNGTIWEHWQDTPVTSLCHPFSCSPMYDLSSYVAGVTPIESGFARFRVCPMLGDLSWVTATLPTPHGNISVRWEVDESGDLSLQLEVPPGCVAEVQPPRGFIGAIELDSGTHEITMKRRQ
jgi:hypothetical protein